MVDADIPDLSGLAIASSSIARIQQSHTPGSPFGTTQDLSQLDTSLASALSHLIHRLTRPLSASIPQARLTDLCEVLREVLHDKYIATWDETTPVRGSGHRSLICQKHSGLPAELRKVAKQFHIDGNKWIRALASKKTIDGVEVVVREEWEVWCDPGLVAWRYGTWEWEDVGFEPTRLVRGMSLTPR